MKSIVKYFMENQKEIAMALYSMNPNVNSWKAMDTIERFCK